MTNLALFASALDDVASNQKAFAHALRRLGNAERKGDQDEKTAAGLALNEARAAGQSAYESLVSCSPAGFKIRPATGGLSFQLDKEGEGASVAQFYLNAPGTRVRDPDLTRLAWAAVQAIGAAVEPAPLALPVIEPAEPFDTLEGQATAAGYATLIIGDAWSFAYPDGSISRYRFAEKDQATRQMVFEHGQDQGED